MLELRILDHYQKPRFHGILAEATHHGESSLHACGDSVSVEAIIRDGRFVRFQWLGDGCCISQAAGSILAEEVNSKPVSYVRDITEDDVFALLLVDIKPVRRECALVAFKALQDLLSRV